MPDEKKVKTGVGEIADACKDSPGYVIFAAILGRNRDKAGIPIVNYHYRRYFFSYDDTYAAIKEFKKQLVEDVQKSMKDV
jgi:hypothetical protein